MGREFWGGLVEWMEARMLGEGMISPEDIRLFHVTDEVDEAIALIRHFTREQDASLPP